MPSSRLCQVVDVQPVNTDISNWWAPTRYNFPFSLVTSTQMTSRRREVDANTPSVVANSSISGCVEWVKPDCVSLGSTLSDQELATDYELSDNENECTDKSDSRIDNLNHLWTAKSTEFKLKDNILGYEYISKTCHHGWTPVRVERIGAKEQSLMLLFLRSVRKFLLSMWVVLWELKYILAKLHSSPQSVQELIQRLATNLLS